jgi:hypothetical protein
MNTVAEIKSAIASLTLEERAQLVAELCEWQEDDWDRQMQSDATAGKFATLNERADAEYKAGKTTPLAQILNES